MCYSHARLEDLVRQFTTSFSGCASHLHLLMSDQKIAPPAVLLEGLTKTYPLFSGPVDRLKQLLGISSRSENEGGKGVAALSDINLRIERGQIFGVVGKNGSGKSTLLRLLTGVLPASSGRIDCPGKVAALLELGAGFNPEFSGRDNVLIACALLGIDDATAEARLPDIEAFADVGAFFDRPVKTYSTGMYARVAFAALAVCEPDVLILDEILAVGDEAFQRKCLARIEQLAASGCTVILVTHNSQLVIEFCHAAALLSNGRLVIAGEPKAVVHEYYRSQGFTLASTDSVSTEGEEIAATPSTVPLTVAPKSAFHDPSLLSSSTVSYGNADALIDNLRLVDGDNQQVNVMPRGSAYRLCYRVTMQRPASKVEFGSLIKTTKGVELGGLALGGLPELAEVSEGTVFEVSIPFVANLMPGTYFVNAGVRGEVNGVLEYLHRLMDAATFRILEESESPLRGIVDLSVVGEPPSFVISQPGISESQA